MIQIPVSEATPGKKLAQAIYDKSGTVLFLSGEVLSKDMLSEIARLGIANIQIQEAPPSAAPATTAAETTDDMVELVNKLIAARFGTYNTNDPYIAMVRNLALERESRTLLSRHGKVPSSMPASTVPAFKTQNPGPVPMQQLLRASADLGTLPVVFHKLVAVINSPYASASDAANIISTDPALSVKLLRLVNSAFYGLPTKIDTIQRAVTLIGTGQLVMLAMGATLVTAFKGLPVSMVNMQSFWTHSLACGVAAKLISKCAKIQNNDSFFVTGLLHDIGRMMFYHRLPAQSFYMLTESRRRNVSLHELEKECLGFTHEVFGAALLREWGCPDELARRISVHHSQITATTSVENLIVPAANFLAQSLGYGSSGDQIVSYIPTTSWQRMNITPSLLPEIAAQMEEQVRALRSLLTHPETA